MMQPSQPEMFGMYFRDERVHGLTKRVLALSSCAAFLGILQGVIPIAVNGLGNSYLISSLLGVAIALLVPCCGYFGAKNNNRSQMCCFCCCNFLCGCCHIAGVVFFVGMEALVRQWLNNCDPNVPEGVDPMSGCPSHDDWVALCQQVGSTSDIDQCVSDLHDVLNSGAPLLIVAVVFALPAVCLNCASFIFGKQLYDELGHSQVVVQAPAAIYINQQPGQPRTTLG